MISWIPFIQSDFNNERSIYIKNVYDEKFDFEEKYKTIKLLFKSDEELFKPDIPGSLRKNQEKEVAELQFKNEAKNGKPNRRAFYSEYKPYGDEIT